MSENNSVTRNLNKRLREHEEDEDKNTHRYSKRARFYGLIAQPPPTGTAVDYFYDTWCTIFRLSVFRRMLSPTDVQKLAEVNKNMHMSVKTYIETTYYFRRSIENKHATFVIYNNHTKMTIMGEVPRNIPKTIKAVLVEGWKEGAVNKIHDAEAVTQFLVRDRHGSKCGSVRNLPSTVQTLVLPPSFNQILDKLPTDLVNLSIGTSIDSNPFAEFEIQIGQATHKHPFENVLGRFSRNFDWTHIPMTRLVLGCHFNRSVKNCLPRSLTYLFLGNRFDQPVDGLLPQGLTHLMFGDEFNRTVDNLPQTVTHLWLGKYFSSSLSRLPHVRFLALGESNSYSLANVHHTLMHLDIRRVEDISSIAPLPRCRYVECDAEKVDNYDKDLISAEGLVYSDLLNHYVRGENERNKDLWTIKAVIQ